jgi:alpha-beta hydrolase superfamily lysophospholipase
MVVAFRGSGTVGESLMDYDTKCKIHSGFLTEFNAIEPVLKSLISPYHDKFEDLVITGHGIGGALATICAPHFANMCPQTKISCITFGSPRVGDKAFCDWFNSATNIELKLRLVIEDDPLPMFPSTSPYQHVHDAICLRHDGRLEKWPDTDQRSDMPFGSLVMYIVSVFVHLQWEYDDRFSHACEDIQRRKGA